MKSAKRYLLWFFRNILPATFLLFSCCLNLNGQCLSAVNPVGGSQNLLVLEKNTLRVITFYRYHYGNRYFEGDSPSTWDIIRYGGYNYAGAIVGYGITNSITLETEWGYFINKTQIYRGSSGSEITESGFSGSFCDPFAPLPAVPEYRMKGFGFSGPVVSVKGSIVKDDINRFFISASGGVRIPLSRNPQIRNGVVLPIEVQPSSGAWGGVAQLFIVKERPVSGTRYFLTARMETNGKNSDEYRIGNALYTSLFISKHLMFPWLKGDWTAIMQLRNELRGHDHLTSGIKKSSGGDIIYLSPQLNYFIKEKWNLSLTADIPLYQYFHGTQMSSKLGVSLNLARDFAL